MRHFLFIGVIAATLAMGGWAFADQSSGGGNEPGSPGCPQCPPCCR